MVPGKFFLSVLLQGLQELQNLLHGFQEQALPFLEASLVSPVIPRTFPFARKISRISSLKFKGIFSKFYLHLQYTPGLWDSCLAKPRRSLNRSWDCVEVLGIMVCTALSIVEQDQLKIGSAIQVGLNMFMRALQGGEIFTNHCQNKKIKNPKNMLASYIF